MRDYNEDINAIRRVLDITRRYSLDKIVTALALNDKQTIAQFRLSKRKADAKANQTIAAYEAAQSDEAKLAIFGACKMDDSVFEHSQAEVASELSEMNKPAVV